MPLTADRVQARLRGVAVGVLTPFDDSLEIDYQQLEENARDLYDEGPRTFLAAANISEYHSLSQSERIQSTETVLNSLPSDACVIAGVGGSTDAASELIEGYDRTGVDAMMVMPPDHTYVHEEGILRYYEKLASKTTTPLIPYIRGFDPSIRFLGQLTRIDGVSGVKYALKDPVKLGRGISRGDDDVVWIDGLAEPFAVSFWNEGIEGFSAGVSNFRPEAGLELYDALTNENWDRARQLRDVCMPFQDFRDRPGKANTIAGAISVPVVKKGLELAGYHAGSVREPIHPLHEEHEERVEELYQQLDNDLSRLVS